MDIDRMDEKRARQFATSRGVNYEIAVAQREIA